MLAISLLSLFTVGLAAMAGGGTSPFEEPQEDAPASDPDVTTDEATQDDTDATPIETSEPVETPEQPASLRPPTGDEYRDPQVIHEQAEAAAALARAPETLLTATDIDGAEVADESLLRAGPISGEDADRDYLVVPPVQGETDIDVGYNPDTTFLIALGEGVQTVAASLNSNIEPAASNEITETEEITGPDGAPQQQITQTQSFDAATEITFSVSEAQIGAHVAKIDLSNPNDTLHFDFDGDISGNLHLVTNEVEQSSVDGSLTERTMYVIETTANLTEITPYQIGLFVQANGEGYDDARMVAEIYLGEDAVNVEDGDTIIRNFMNDTPQITSNVTWSSEGVNDGTTPETPTTSGSSFNGFDFADLPFGEPSTVDDTPDTTDNSSGNDNGIINLFEDNPELDLSDLDQGSLNNLTADEIRDLVDFVDNLDLDGLDTPNLNSPQWGGLGLI